MGDARSIHQQLKAIRKQWGLSPLDLAEIVGVCERTIDSWEQSEHQITFGKLVQWADALGYDVKLELRKSRPGRGV